MNKIFPKLYSRTSTGAIQTWVMTVEDNTFFTSEGQLNGAQTVSKPTVCYGKNVGKSNETSDDEQALSEAQSRYDKKLRTGYTEDINKIDSCMTYFECMLAKKYDDYKDKIKFPVLASIKIDGARMVNILNSTTSREGDEYLSCPHIGNALKPFFKKHNKGMIDGEIFAKGQDFEKIMSLVRTKKPTPEDLIESEKLCKLWIFDGIVDNPKEGFSKRFENVKKELKSTIDAKTLAKYFVFVDNVLVNNHEELVAEHDKYVSQKFEGVIVRFIDAPYEQKRSKFLLKLKAFVDEEMEIVDFLEGDGSDAGLASKIVVRLKDGSTSEAGIRGDNEYTTQLLKDRKHYIGKLATVRYQGFTKYGKLRFGVAVNIDRFDI